MMMKPHETKIPNTMAKVFGFDLYCFSPYQRNCDNVQSSRESDAQHHYIRSYFVIPLFSLCSPPLPLRCSYENPHFLNHPKTIFFFFSSIHRMAWNPTKPRKCPPSQVPRSRSCCVLERVFRLMYKRVVSYFSVTWWIRRDGCTRVDRECNSPEAWGGGSKR